MEIVVARFFFFSFLSVALVFFQSPFCLSELASGSPLEGEIVVRVDSILSTATCFPSAATTGASDSPSRKLVYRHGPCSPSWLQGDEATFEPFSYVNLVQDQLRVDSIHQVLSPKDGLRSNKLELPAKVGVWRKTGIANYIVQVGFGTPTKSISVTFDTASDLTWIQCDRQFDSSESTSYSQFGCNTTECSQLKSARFTKLSCFDQPSCGYNFKYGSMSSRGYFAKDRLTVEPDVFQSFKFGCGINNQGKFGSAAGLLGLGRNKLSFISQTSAKYDGVFSYCLPSTSSATGYLSLGREKGKKAYESVNFTPMVTDARGPSFYFVTLTGIRVDGVMLPVSASVYKTSGMIVDSGTSITRLPPAAYIALRSAFQKHMSGTPTAPALSILDTCYNLTGIELWSPPRITFIFEGDVELDMLESSIAGGGSVSQVCMGFAGNNDASDVAILGTTQQQKLKIVYDIANKKIGFGPQDCDTPQSIFIGTVCGGLINRYLNLNRKKNENLKVNSASSSLREREAKKKTVSSQREW